MRDDSLRTPEAEPQFMPADIYVGTSKTTTVNVISRLASRRWENTQRNDVSDTGPITRLQLG